MSDGKPLSMARIFDAFARAPRPSRMFVSIHYYWLSQHAFALGLVLEAEGEVVLTSTRPEGESIRSKGMP